MMDSDPEDPNSSSSSDSQTPLIGSYENRVVLIGGHNIWEWTFLSLCIPDVILLLASSGFTLTECATNYRWLNISCVFEMQVCIICATSLIFAIYGVFGEHQYDICLHSVLVFFAIVYAFVSWITENYIFINLVLNGCAAVLWLVCLALGRKATTVPDWTEFRIIGVSDPLAAMYKQVCYFWAVLKFDSLFLVLVASSSTYILYRNSTRTYVLLGLVVLYSAISWTCGKIAIIQEDMYLSCGFIALTLAYPALVAYQCYELLVSVKRMEEIFYYLEFAFGLLVIITKIHLVFQMKKTWQTFGYGLNTRSFQVLVTRDPSSLLAHSRSALVH